jgi:hypothetical protein
MAQVPCKKCGAKITESTFQRNAGLCMPCKQGKVSISCAGCGQTISVFKRGPFGLFTGNLCLTCLGAREKQKPTQIDRWIRKRGRGDCTLLRALFKLEERLRLEGADGWIGLNLIDPPEHYSNCGTVLYRPKTTPTNTVAFAHTGGDDVHYSLVQHGKAFGDNSPVVMTVPMGSVDVGELNLILGANLHEFLCLGCVHGYADLEDLYYEREEAIARLSDSETEEDGATLNVFRRELGLEPWKEIAGRLAELQSQFQSALEFKRTWFGWRF